MFDYIDEKFDQIHKMFNQIHKMFDQIDRRFDQIDKEIMDLKNAGYFQRSNVYNKSLLFNNCDNLYTINKPLDGFSIDSFLGEPILVNSYNKF